MEEPQPKLKEAMKTWNAAVAAHASGRYSDTIGFYGEISNKSARMYYNISCAYEKLNDVDNALKCLTNAVEKDPLLAIAYFQRGSLLLLQKRTKEATTDLEKAKTLMRGNDHINYKPLGLLCRMNSYQVLHNSALACIHDNKTAEARTLLTEALYNADDVQKQVVNKTMEHLQTGDVGNIKPVLIPTDRVFSPPKSITKNLVKKSLMQKARVVSAADTEDLSPQFNGIKRVEEIKQLQAKNDTLSPLAAMRRFVKKPRDRRFSDVTDLNPSRPLRSSKSMGDIYNFEQFSDSRTNAKSRDKNVLNLRMTSSTSDSNINQIPESTTPVTEQKTHKSPRSPLRGVKKLLRSKAGTRTSAPVFESVEPVLVMRGCGSTGDLGQLEMFEDEPIMTTFAEMKSISNNTLYKNDLDAAANGRNSLDDMFGKSLPVGQTLSTSSDVFTAIDTPLEHGCDGTDVESSERSSDSDSTSSAEENNERERPRFFIERDCDRNTSIVKRINFIKPEKDKVYQENSTTLTTTTSRDDVTSSVIARDNLENKDTTADVIQTRKSRPPPPAYPPPPLPQIVVNDA